MYDGDVRVRPAMGTELVLSATEYFERVDPNGRGHFVFAKEYNQTISKIFSKANWPNTGTLQYIRRRRHQIFSEGKYVIDGCAIFFKKDKFALIKKYEWKFNKAALSL